MSLANGERRSKLTSKLSSIVTRVIPFRLPSSWPNNAKQVYWIRFIIDQLRDDRKAQKLLRAGAPLDLDALQAVPQSILAGTLGLILRCSVTRIDGFHPLYVSLPALMGERPSIRGRSYLNGARPLAANSSDFPHVRDPIKKS